MTSHQRIQDFIAETIGLKVLDDAIDWIGIHVDPDEVYSRGYLKKWAMKEFNLIESEDK